MTTCVISFALLAALATRSMVAAGSNPHPALGGYRPASNVVEHSQMVFDVKDITLLVNAGNFSAARAIYAEGRFSCKSTTNPRTFQGFVNSAAVSKLQGRAWFDSFTGGTGPTGATEAWGPIPGTGRLQMGTTFYDEHLEEAFAGTGDFAPPISETMRKVFINKAILGVLALYANYELESAIEKANDGNTVDTGAPHAWDEGWAFYYGSHIDGPGKWSAWEFASKRDFDFTQDSAGNEVATATKVTDEILPHFIAGLKASREGDVSMMITARDNIYRLLALTSIRAALKYAYTAQHGGDNNGYSEAYHMEAWVYFLAAAGWVEQAAPGVASTVLSLLDFQKTSDALEADLYCAVQEALIPAYAPLGIDCEKVGVWKGLPASKTCADLPACPAVTSLPQGMSSYDFDTDTSPGSNVDCPLLLPGTGNNPHPVIGGFQPASNVVEHSQMVFDVKDITLLVNAGNFSAARAIYAEGRFSCKSTTNPRTFQGFVNSAAVSKLQGRAWFDSFTGGTGPTGATEAWGPIPGTGRLQMGTTFYDEHLEEAFAGTGDFAPPISETMRKVFINKAILGVLALYANYELESAIEKANDGNTVDTGAPHAWDEGWAFYYGSHIDGPGKWSAWEFASKRDFDFTQDSAGNEIATATKVAEEILPHFRTGLKGSRHGDLTVMITARDNIYRLLALTSIRAALKYAYTAQHGGDNNGYSEAYHMEAWVYFLAAAGWIEQAAPGVASTVLSLLDFQKTSDALEADLYCAVQAALIPAYAPLGIDCEKVGVWKGLPASKTCANLPACPTVTTLPQGMSSYDFDTDTTPGSNVDCPLPLPGSTAMTTSTTAEPSSTEEMGSGTCGLTALLGFALPLMVVSESVTSLLAV